MYNKFDRLNRETRDYNNGVSGRNLGWYDVVFGGRSTVTSNSNNKKGRYLGNGQYVED